MILYIEKIKPRISDINYGGHVGHMELLGLLHEIRAQFLKKNNMTEIEIDGCALLMKQILVNYTNEAFWDDELEIRMGIKPSKAKIIFNYEVYNLEKENVTAIAEAAMILFDKTVKKLLKPNLFFEKLNYDSRSNY